MKEAVLAGAAIDNGGGACGAGQDRELQPVVRPNSSGPAPWPEWRYLQTESGDTGADMMTDMALASGSLGCGRT
jgi:hypothetical protein